MKLAQLFHKPAAKDPLDASAVPEGRGVRSLNNLPLVIGVVFFAIFLGIIGHVMMQRSEERAQQEQEQAQKQGASAANQAGEITGPWGNGGLIPPNALKKEAAPPEAPVAVQPELQLPDLPAAPGTPTKAEPLRPASTEESALWNARFQALQAGLRSKTGVQMPEQGGGTAGRPQVQRSTNMNAGNDVTAAYQARLAQIRGEVGGAGMGAGDVGALTGTSERSPDNGLGQFDRNNRWTLQRQVEAPASPYELRAGFVIPAIMISGINSDLPGQVMAQVSQNVFDTATGKYLLIPQGTRLIGSYNSSVAYGQQRILMAWQRLIFPDGKALDIEAMPGADSAGYGGFNDQVNNHYWRIFGSSFLLSGVIAAVSMSQDQGSSNSDSDRQRAGDALSEALGQTMGSAMSEMLRKNLNISPTLEVRPGYRFNVMVVKDIRFKEPYSSFNY